MLLWLVLWPAHWRLPELVLWDEETSEKILTVFPFYTIGTAENPTLYWALLGNLGSRCETFLSIGCRMWLALDATSHTSLLLCFWAIWWMTSRGLCHFPPMKLLRLRNTWGTVVAVAVSAKALILGVPALAGKERLWHAETLLVLPSLARSVAAWFELSS
jgi:hypothetical protein